MAEEKLFTQEEVNKIVQERLSKDRASRTSSDPVMTAQIEDLTKRLEAAERKSNDEKALRIETNKATSLIAALEKNNATKPSEIAKILKGNIIAKDDDSIFFVADDGKECSVEDGVASWLKGNSWAVKVINMSGSGAPVGGGSATTSLRESFGLPTCK